MAYLEENLMAGERVVYRTSLHKIVFFWPVLILLVSLRTGMAVFLIGVAVAVYAYLRYTSSEFGVTNKRVMVKVGIFSRRSIEILLTKVEGIGVNQGMVGRSWDYGTIVVTGTGGTKEPFKMITKPFEFRKQVQEQIAMAQTVR
jgi:uncharacterized membrane protein YdbT with pleckstrin-like domain